MGEIEEEIHHKMIALFRDTGFDADTILISRIMYEKLKEECVDRHRNPLEDNLDGMKFKGMDVFVQDKQEDYLELLPLKQLKENNYV